MKQEEIFRCNFTGLRSRSPWLFVHATELTEVPADAIEAARGMGMTETQALWRVRLPLALPVVVGGVRVAAVTAVGVASVAALVAAGGLGDSIFAGLRTNDSTEVLAATFLIAALALAVDGSLALLERGLRRGP